MFFINLRYIFDILLHAILRLRNIDVFVILLYFQAYSYLFYVTYVKYISYVIYQFIIDKYNSCKFLFNVSVECLHPSNLHSLWTCFSEAIIFLRLHLCSLLYRNHFSKHFAEILYSHRSGFYLNVQSCLRGRCKIFRVNSWGSIV